MTARGFSQSDLLFLLVSREENPLLHSAAPQMTTSLARRALEAHGLLPLEQSTRHKRQTRLQLATMKASYKRPEVGKDRTSNKNLEIKAKINVILGVTNGTIQARATQRLYNRKQNC
jgi:hypothetical protein